MFGVGVGIRVGGFTPISGGGGFDPDAQAFFDRVTTAGGTLTTTEKNATNQLVLDMKSAGIWTSMKAVYPMVGASAAACAQNLKSSSFTGSFTSGWTFASTGVTPNGTSAYMDTGLVPNTNLSQNSSSGGSYINSLSAGSVNKSDVYFGASNSGFANGFYLLPMANGDNKDYSRNNTNSAPATSSWTDCKGFYQMYRTVSTSYVVRRNNTPTTYSIASVSPTTFPVWIAALNNTGTLTEPSSNRIALSYFGDGLTDTQASNFYTAVQTFNQTLNRQVGAQIVSDADAQAYINRVYTAGGTLTNTEANAVNQLVIDMKAAGIWTAMKAVYPMVGASAAACAQNLKSSSFTGSFTSGWTFSSTGATPNGTSAYMDTSLTPSASLTQDSTHLSFYSRTNISSNQQEIGSQATNPDRFNLEISYNGNLSSDQYNYLTGRVNVANSDSRGFYIGSRTNSTTHKAFKNNAQIGTTNTTASGTLSLMTNPIWIGVSNGSTNYSTKQCAFASIGDGLTDTQAASLYTCVQTFNTTLSRQV